MLTGRGASLCAHAQALMLQEGVVQPLVALLRQSGLPSACKLHAVAVLASLSVNTAANKERLGEAGTVPVLLELLANGCNGNSRQDRASEVAAVAIRSLAMCVWPSPTSGLQGLGFRVYPWFKP